MAVFSHLFRFWKYLTGIGRAEPDTRSRFEYTCDIGQRRRKSPDFVPWNLAADTIFRIRMKISKKCECFHTLSDGHSAQQTQALHASLLRNNVEIDLALDLLESMIRNDHDRIVQGKIHERRSNQLVLIFQYRESLATERSVLM